MFRHTSNDGSDADSDDSIGLTSTVYSEDDPDNTYIVENILAERWFSDEERTKYLVKWEGYAIERASWEPIEMFDDKNTINEWKALKQRHESGDSPPQFDWRQWDADREREAYDQQIRKMRRVKKRQRLQMQKVAGVPTSSRESRASSAKVKTFRDDIIVISGEEESESDVQRPKRKRRRRVEDAATSEGTEEGEDSGNTSVDSLMETLARKAKRARRSTRDARATDSKKRKTKMRVRRSVGEEGSEAEEEAWISEDQTRKKPLNVTQNGKSTRPARRLPATRDRDYEGRIAAATSTLSRMDVQPNKTSILASIMSKSGPRKRQPSSSKDPVVVPGAVPLPGVPKVGKFISLSQANRMYKRSRNEPEPDINNLELFPAGAPAILARRVSGPGITPTEIRHFPHDATSKPKEIIQPSGKGNLGALDEDDPRGPKRRKTDEGPKVQTLSLVKYQETIAKRRDSAQQAPVTLPVTNAEPNEPELEDLMGMEAEDDPMVMSIREDALLPPAVSSGPSVDSWGAKKPPTGPAGWQTNRMDIDQPGSPDTPVKPTFECELEIGLASKTENMGTVTFTGFTSNFTSFVERLQIERLWVSRFLEDAYISNFLVPEMGIPFEFADMEVDRDKSQPFISSLVVLHGAGVILHEDFTLLIFQPSNDKLRQAFKTPMQQQRTALRAVAYPPFDVPVPAPDSSREAVAQRTRNEQLTSGFYIHTILDKMLGVNCMDILQSSKGSDNIIIYCPEIARAEQDEMEYALKVLKRGCWPVNEIPGRMEKYEKHGSKIRLCVLVHFSLKRQLHLLPHIKHLKTRDHAFYFFGTRLERAGDSGMLATYPVRFWNFGTLILLTPQFVMENEKATRDVLQYQRAKAASTTICYSGTMLARAEAYYMKNPEKAELALRNVYALIDRKKRGEAVELQVQDTEGCDELETIADAFALHQLEHCTEYRRFMIGHSKDENSYTAKAGLYDCIEFHDPESLVYELTLRAPGKPPLRKRLSEPGQTVIENK